jgi:integrase
MSRTELLVLDALEDTLIRSVPLPQTPEVNLSAAVIKARLAEWEIKYAEANASATLRAVRADWGVYTRWCETTGVWGLPIAPKDLQQFLEDQIVLGKRRSTLNRYVATLKLIHKAAGLPDPTKYPHWSLDWKTLVGKLADKKANAPRQAAALKSDGVATILGSLGEDLRALRDGALLALASDTLCRESELVRVCVEDITPNGEAFALLVPFSKTDQQGLGSERYVDTETKERIDRWCAAAGITKGYLFPAIGRRNLEGRGVPNEKHLRADEVAKIFRKRAIAAELPSGNAISGHSTRVGSAVELIESGQRIADVQFAGGWQSERMVLQYGRKARAGQGAMASLRAKKRRSTD